MYEQWPMGYNSTYFVAEDHNGYGEATDILRCSFRTATLGRDDNLLCPSSARLLYLCRKFSPYISLPSIARGFSIAVVEAGGLHCLLTTWG